jgi:hypothetical protein
MPASEKSGDAPKEVKSVLKKTDYEGVLQDIELKEKDCFSTEITRAQIKKRQVHLKKYLEA